MTAKKRPPAPASAKRARASARARPADEGGAPAPVSETSLFPIVGVGASAGGLEAFKELLHALPRDTGMAFVLVQHLAPSHVSMLAEILSRETKLPVKEVKDEPAVQPNHVYVIPPDRGMTISGGVLQLQARKGAPAVHHPIDQFFGSLAKDRGHQAIGVILSGTASDGTAGLAEIKAAGGIAFAQDDTAEHRGMPRSAIAAGCVDFVLPPNAIAGKLADIARHPHIHASPAAALASAAGPDFTRIVELVHRSTGVNFGQYKASTLHRRITRRMAIEGVAHPEEYLAALKNDHGELTALYQDILIGVTQFFRNREAFEAISARVLPRLLKGRASDQPLRVWVLGCSTGEEAYSLAIVLAEFAESRHEPMPIQVFATDLNGAALEKARAGIYPKTIVRDVAPERVRRFFLEVDGHYRVAKQIRDMCVFAQHNVLVDPPFSRMDLITCRNLLIYLEPALQQKVVPLLHYALEAGGFLVLGGSETVGSHRDLFEVDDAKQKIFVKKPGSARPLPNLSGRDYRAAQPGPRAFPAGTALDEADLQKEADRLLLTKYAPASVLVDENLEILQFRGDTGAYLAPGPGKASLGLMKMAREGLLVPLRATIARARKQGSPAREEGVQVKSNGGHRRVDLEAIPLKPIPGRVPKGGAGFLVLFEESGAGARAGHKAAATPGKTAAAERKREPDAGEAEIARLMQELAVTREYLQSVIDQQEVTNEELQSSNEEVQSANEELQSTNEELETSKEEIQSSNEELTTVNDELQHRNRELGSSNADLINLLDSVQMPIVMVGHDLRIRRFTPMAERILQFIPADLGRPIGNINLELSIGDLQPLLLEVMGTLATKEVEIRDKNGVWYSLRIKPYKTLDNKIDGAVLTLIDVDTLRRARAYAQSIVATVREPLLVLDADLRVRTASRSFYQTFGHEPAETENRVLYDLAQGQWDLPELRRLLGAVLREDRAFEDYEMQCEFGTVGRKTLRLNARRLIQEVDLSPLVLLAIEDVTERAQLASDLEQRIEELAAAHRSKDQFLAVMAHELRNPLAPLHNVVHLLKTQQQAPGALAAALPMMERQIRNLTRLVDDLLDVSRVTRDKVQLRKERVDLCAAVSSAVEAARPALDAKRLQLAVSLPQEPVYLDADPTRLEQIFGNLLNNACKFTRGGGHISLSVGVVAEGQAGSSRQAVIRVSDDGIGMGEDTLPRVFDLFMQADRSLERAQSGLGIGLTLVRSLVQLHGGRVDAYSAGLGKGSEFTVRLPLPDGADEETQGSPAGAQGGEQLLAGSAPRRVLVVDDNEDAAGTLAALLSAAGHDVKTSHSGADTLELATAFRPEVIVLDIGLPGMDGYEVARRLRRQPGNGKALLIALTGYGRDEDRMLAQESGFDHHLTKPVDLRQLKQLLGGAQPSA